MVSAAKFDPTDKLHKLGDKLLEDYKDQKLTSAKESIELKVCEAEAILKPKFLQVLKSKLSIDAFAQSDLSVPHEKTSTVPKWYWQEVMTDWRLGSNSGDWIPFTDGEAEELERGFQVWNSTQQDDAAKMMSVYDCRAEKCMVDYSTMQRRKLQGNERWPVKRVYTPPPLSSALKKILEGSFLWFWEEDQYGSENWKPYPPERNVILENHFQNWVKSYGVAPSDFSLHGNSTGKGSGVVYSVDFKSMDQTNPSSGFTRRIYRIRDPATIEEEKTEGNEDDTEEKKQEDEEEKVNEAPSTIIWAFGTGTGSTTWQDFSDAENKEIETAYQKWTEAGSSETNKNYFSLPSDASYAFNFFKMIQEGSSTPSSNRKVQRKDMVTGKILPEIKTYTWQYEDHARHSGVWKSYPAQSNTLLEAGYTKWVTSKSDSDKILTMGGFSSGIGKSNSYNINFKKMEQTNSATGFSRRLKRVEKVNSVFDTITAGVTSFPSTATATLTGQSNPPVWKYEDHNPGSNVWVSYPALTCAIIEANYQKWKKSRTDNDQMMHLSGFSGGKGAGVSYLIDFLGMTQMNTDSGFLRALKRENYVDFKASKNYQSVFQWSRQSTSDGNWKNFPAEENKQIDEMHIQWMMSGGNMSPQFVLNSLGGKKYFIDIVSMVRTSEKGNQVEIRRAPLAQIMQSSLVEEEEEKKVEENLESTEKPVWNVEDETAGWQPLSEENQEALESAYQNFKKKGNPLSKMVALKVGEEDFICNVDSMTKKNVATGVCVDMARQLGGQTVTAPEAMRAFHAFASHETTLAIFKGSQQYLSEVIGLIRDVISSRSKAILGPEDPDIPTTVLDEINRQLASLNSTVEIEDECYVLHGATIFKSEAARVFRKQSIVLTENVLSLQPPEDWKPGMENQIWSIDPMSAEYRTVEASVKKSISSAKVKRIEKIQNHHLWQRFSLLKSHFANKYPDQDQAIQTLFHGTKTTDPKIIWNSDEGFDSRCANTGMWGVGIYFAETAAYSHSYSHDNDDGDHQIFYADVLVGQSVTLKSDQSLKKPPTKPGYLQRSENETYDSVNGITYNTKVYIIYKNEQVYPKYLITYSG